MDAHRLRIRLLAWLLSVIITLSSVFAIAAESTLPATVDAGTHLDGVTQVRFQGVARSNLATATYVTGSCTNACHDVSHLVGIPGAGGGQRTSPRWTMVDGTQRQCDSCHGAPPPLPHPARTDCGACHLNAQADGGFVRPDLHVNGRVEFALP